MRRYPLTRVWVASFTAVVVAIAAIGLVAFHDLLWGVRADSKAAVKALSNGDLETLDSYLDEYRGNKEFAYYFAVASSPRVLGDGLASIAGMGDGQPFGADFNANAFELTLTDLAGTLSLASHGTAHRHLPDSWASDFVLATTTPGLLYGDEVSTQRNNQDTANKSNLLLLLSRGYWSTDFLQTVTEGYYGFNVVSPETAWPSDQISDAIYVASPDGTYLTDGITAISAALTANPTAAEWAFTEFLPGDIVVEGTEYSLGRFTHYLMFEHSFPSSPEGENIGMSAALTALSAAGMEDDGGTATTTIEVESEGDAFEGQGPRHDAAVLALLV